jgi:glycosyltransferase involved in cell wall biosynthesis
MLDLTVIIPVYNEEEIIQEVIKTWLLVLKDLSINFEMKVFNDGSTDDTLSKLKEIVRDERRLTIIDKPNSGHGPTILEGYKSADSKWIFQVDSDNEISPVFFPKLWANKDNLDLIIGLRKNRKSPFIRKGVTLVAQLIVKIFYGREIKDTNSPYRLYRTDKFRNVFNMIPSDIFAPNVILSGYAVKKKLRVLEIPVDFKQRTTGNVSIRKFKLLKASCKSLVQTIKCSFLVR